MIALTRTDKCFSIIPGSLGRVFNTDRQLRNELNPEEVRSAFDFQIVKKQSFDEAGRKIPGHFHIVRSDNQDFIPSSGLGKKFVPIQHIDIFDSVVKEIIPLANEVMSGAPRLELETVGTLHGGGTGICTVRAGEPFKVAGDSSECYIRIVFANPCNGRGSIIIGCAIVRERCQSLVPVACGGFSVHHTRNAHIHLATAMKCVLAQTQTADEVRRRIEEMGELDIGHGDNDEFLSRLIDRIYPITHKKGTAGYTRQFNIRSEVRTQYYGGDVAMSIKGDSAWKVYNAFVYPIFHPVSMGRNMDFADIFYAGMIGGKRQMLGRIFSAVSVAGAKDA